MQIQYRLVVYDHVCSCTYKNVKLATLSPYTLPSPSHHDVLYVKSILIALEKALVGLQLDSSTALHDICSS